MYKIYLNSHVIPKETLVTALTLNNGLFLFCFVCVVVHVLTLYLIFLYMAETSLSLTDG